jgi:selenocysteine lyase/cysteine desulfurase
VIYTVLEHVSNSAMWETLFPEARVHLVGTLKSDRTIVDHRGLEQALKAALDTVRPSTYLLVAFTACSNVLGQIQPVTKLLDIVQKYRSQISIVTCVDCAACAPYVPLQPFSSGADVLFISPHKFKGGYSTPGVMVVRKNLMDASRAPFFPGGGTVWYKDKSTCYRFLSDVEHREEGGTPNIVGIIKTGLLFERKTAIQKAITRRTLEIVTKVDEFFDDPDLRTSIDMFTPVGKRENLRLPIYSFRVRGVHPGLFVKVLSDRYGIQARSGVSCCYLLAADLCQVGQCDRNKILKGKGTPETYGWVRLSFNYANRDHHIDYVLSSVAELVSTISGYEEQYRYECSKNEWKHLYRDVKDLTIEPHIDALFEAARTRRFPPPSSSIGIFSANS